ncbi:hypothetical protein VNO80_14057 [Phaseolus coccineus]|uniref:Uncharacterized protein n=1 Tax=Phaseolus coccineus TaxID=3886 RepID=A0AAN9RAF1_PHACN
MSSKDSKVEEVTPVQVKREDIFYSADNEIMFSRELHAGSSSHLKPSDGGVVEGKLHGSSPSYSDKNSTDQSGVGQQLSFSEEDEEEEMNTPVSYKSSNGSKKRMKLDHQKNPNSEKNIRGPVHDLPGPPPERVTWVLTSAPNQWDAYVNGRAVSEAEKLRWAEAFVLSTRDDGDNGNN